jgi:chitinase
MAVELLLVTFQEYSVNQWLNAGVSASKLLLGIPLFGRSYTLANPENNGVGAPVTGSGKPGQFTGEPGFLSYYEVFQTVFL